MDQVLFHLAQSRAGMGFFKEAVQGLESLILSHPESGFAAQALLEKGKLEGDQLGEPEKAIATFSHLISRYPLTRQHDEGFMELGDCYLLSNDITSAKKTYEQLGRMAFSKNRIAFMHSVIRLAEIDFFTGRFESSMSRLDSLFQNWLEPEEAQDVLVNDALSLNLMMKTYIQIDREALSVLASGLLLSRQRQVDQAEALFDKLIAGKKNGDLFIAEGLFQKGELLFAAERFDESLSCYKKLLAACPVSVHSERAMERMGRLLEKTGRIREAVQTYEQFIELYPRSFSSGEIRKHLQDMEAARP
jgi:tetratricopeptide (TPR) repeat protein